MEKPPSSDQNNQSQQYPQAETLTSGASETIATQTAPVTTPIAEIPKHRSYRPSHKATFIGLAAVTFIILVNAVVLGFVLKKQSHSNSLLSKGEVSISSSDLSRLGVNRSSLGNSDIELIIAPNTQLKGKLSVAGVTNISGPVTLNNKLTGTDANLSQLQAGNTELSQLNVNGNSTLSALNLRKDLVVAGLSQLQGPVTINQLLTVASNVNISGNLAIGGTLTVSTFSARSLTSTSTLTIGGHIITNGLSPGVGPGSALGSNGTVSLSGNDAAGVIAINIGVGAGGGILANVAFKTQYTSVPRVVVSPVGIGGNFYITNLTTSGFSVAVSSGLAPGGYKINYIALQ